MAKKVRRILRAMHRDIGYLLVGLTFVYALSGLAVNHIGDWDPNFTHYERKETLQEALPKEDAAAAQAVLDQLKVDEKMDDFYESAPGELTIYVGERTYQVNRESLEVFEVGEKPRLLLRISNWLHLNRGKKSWTYIADAYAIFLLFLASSGVFMLPGKKGIRGRGAILVLLGVAVPVTYVIVSGGP